MPNNGDPVRGYASSFYEPVSHEDRLERAESEIKKSQEIQQAGKAARATPRYSTTAPEQVDDETKQEFLENIANLAQQKKEQSIDETLKERGDKYGSFNRHAEVTQEMYNCFCNHMGRFNRAQALSSAEREAIHMIFHKLGRIANGDPHYKDSWVDIAGYAKLVADTLED